MQLDIHVTLTAGHYHGEEWPPSPARLFQALVAATHRSAHGLLHSDVRDRALEWLESCPPPTIFAITTEPARELITGYVPNNDDGESKDFREHVKTAKSLRLHPLPSECRVTYRWEFAADGDSASADDPRFPPPVAVGRRAVFHCATWPGSRPELCRRMGICPTFVLRKRPANRRKSRRA